jgi:hypothetical protein
MTLESIIDDLYQDKERSIQLLKRHNLYDILENVIKDLNQTIEKKPFDAVRTPEIAATFLTAINSRLSTIQDPDQKQHLELVLRDIGQDLMRKIVPVAKQPKKVFNGIKSALQSAASINGYNFPALTKLLKMETLESELVSDAAIYYYSWKGKNEDLDELAENLKADNLLQSVREFKRLFNKHNDPNLQVRFAKEGLEFLLALFDELKSRKLISPKGNKGHFQPIRAYAVDFENNILIDKSPKTIKYIAQRDAENWSKLTLKAKNWTSGFRL